MKKLSFSQSQFVGSALSHETLPQLRTPHGNPLPEIVIVGKSNVGKSSLINHLLKRKDLARVSATPGKTQTLNFFKVDDELALVDLPGYGYAKATEDLKNQWASAIDHYLKNRPTLKLILFLVDCRREPSAEDCAFAKWVSHHQIPILIIFTKADKLSENERRLNALNCLEVFNTFFYKNPVRFLHYSTKDARSRAELIDNINTILTKPSSQVQA
ncbi:MAG: YihA family ribosome biogenesis GTP-binding protein [Verrucomicrobia bacterium]|nr:YihA family ribosome biogenesis GTP-binding protein [Verrucomicrobiota bacterium]